MGKVITKDLLIQLLQESPCPGNTLIWLRSGSNQSWPVFSLHLEGPWGINGDNPAHLTLSDQDLPGLSAVDKLT